MKSPLETKTSFPFTQALFQQTARRVGAHWLVVEHVDVHCAELPVQAHGAQTVALAGRKASAGQASVLPGHDSGTSQEPALGRHTTLVSLALLGHWVLTPSQRSSASQGPAAGRHAMPFDTAAQTPSA